jgi:16S rRNA (guanine527-N7)-methyltransferase
MKTLEQTIREGMRVMGVESHDAAIARLALHARRVVEANAVMNLTSIAESDFATLHVLDSLSATRYLEGAADAPFADLGSGAGYPGIPLAIVTNRPVSLVESVRKKALFLEAVCAELRLEATVHPIRAEELATTHRQEYGSIVARALSSLPSLVELAAPLLRVGGILVCMKGRRDVAELERGDAAAALCGMARERVDAVTIPGVDATRTIVVYRRTGPSRTKLPRRTGMAQRQPLA